MAGSVAAAAAAADRRVWRIPSSTYSLARILRASSGCGSPFDGVDGAAQMGAWLTGLRAIRDAFAPADEESLDADASLALRRLLTRVYDSAVREVEGRAQASSSGSSVAGARVGLLALGVPVPPGREVELAAAMERLTPLAPLAVGGATAAPPSLRLRWLRPPRAVAPPRRFSSESTRGWWVATRRSATAPSPPPRSKRSGGATSGALRPTAPPAAALPGSSPPTRSAVAPPAPRPTTSRRRRRRRRPSRRTARRAPSTPRRRWRRSRPDERRRPLPPAVGAVAQRAARPPRAARTSPLRAPSPTTGSTRATTRTSRTIR